MSGSVTWTGLDCAIRQGIETSRRSTVAEERTCFEGVDRKIIVLHESLLGSWQCVQRIKRDLGKNFPVSQKALLFLLPKVSSYLLFIAGIV